MTKSKQKEIDEQDVKKEVRSHESIQSSVPRLETSTTNGNI